MLPQRQSNPRIFVSYSSKDNQFGMKLIQDLRSALGDNDAVWHDVSGELRGGDTWWGKIAEELTARDIFIIVLSPDAMASNWVRRELAIAWKERKHIIPVLYRQCEVSPDLMYIQQISFLAPKPYEKAFNELLLLLQGAGLRVITIVNSIELSIEQGDITLFEADVLALKYAQEFYGADALIARKLSSVGIAEDKLRPSVGDYRYVETQSSIKVRRVLFVGVPDLSEFGYQQIKEFSKRVLDILAKEAPSTNHLAMTIHGAGFGLDEIEAFLAQFNGYIDAMQENQLPPNLKYISIVDRDPGRVQRLREALDQNLAHAAYASKIGSRGAYRLNIPWLKNTELVRGGFLQSGWSVRREVASEAKPHVFVAMPFKKDMDDVFYYGIQQPVRAAGFLCERVDQEAFMGDILDQVKKKIETATVVVAELSGANPNVYLEVGYAWGKGRPTILLMRNDREPRFDVRGQRCLKYERIKDLEEALSKELKELKAQGTI